METTVIRLNDIGRKGSLAHGVLSHRDAEQGAVLLRALGDPARLRLLAYMVAEGGADVCICDMPQVVGLSQPTVSHHMKRLVDAGLVTREQRGKWAYFTLVPDQFAAVRGLLALGDDQALAPLPSPPAP